MKVLAIAKTLLKGGAASGARNTIRALEQAGAQVIALDGFAAQGAGGRRFRRTAERVYERIAHGADVHCLRLGPATFDLKKVCKEHQPDIVQLFDVSGNTIAFDDLQSVPVPVVQRLSDFWPYNGAHHYSERSPVKGGFEEWWLRRTIYSGQSQPDLFIAPSSWLAERLPVGPVSVIRNAIAPQLGLIARDRHSAPLRFGFIANPVHDPRKGVAALAPVLDAATAVLGPIELHLFGKGSERGIPVGPNVLVRAHSAFQKSEIARVYSQFDLLLCPSLQDNSPNVVTEALSFGVPVIAQSGTGMDSYVEPRFGALVNFHAGPANAVARDIASLAARYSSASAAALDFATAELAPEKIGGDYLAAYSRMLELRAR